MPHSSNSARADRTPPRRGSSDGVQDSCLEITRDDDECGCAAGCGLDPTVENAGPTALVPPSLAPQPSGGGTTLQRRPLLLLSMLPQQQQQQLLLLLLLRLLLLRRLRLLPPMLLQRLLLEILILLLLRLPYY